MSEETPAYRVEGETPKGMAEFYDDCAVVDAVRVLAKRIHEKTHKHVLRGFIISVCNEVKCLRRKEGN